MSEHSFEPVGVDVLALVNVENLDRVFCSHQQAGQLVDHFLRELCRRCFTRRVSSISWGGDAGTLGETVWSEDGVAPEVELVRGYLARERRERRHRVEGRCKRRDATKVRKLVERRGNVGVYCDRAHNNESANSRHVLLEYPMSSSCIRISDVEAGSTYRNALGGDAEGVRHEIVQLQYSGKGSKVRSCKFVSGLRAPGNCHPPSSLEYFATRSEQRFQFAFVSLRACIAALSKANRVENGIKEQSTQSLVAGTEGDDFSVDAATDLGLGEDTTSVEAVVVLVGEVLGDSCVTGFERRVSSGSR